MTRRGKQIAGKAGSVTIIDYTQTGFQLAGALDSGGYGKMSAQEVKDALDHGDIYALLAEKFPGEIDLSLVRPDAQREIKEQWLDLSLAVNERRKFGVEKDGLCLLIAYCLEGIQRLTPSR